jgi:dTDP-4-dehydrorhamnose reductase
MKRILILGADGNLGSQLFDNASGLYNSQVIIFDKNDLDLLDQDSIISKITKLKPSLIINATAYNAVDKCEEFDDEFDLAKKINGEALKYLAKAAIKNDAILIHYSSDYVFGGDACSVEDDNNSFLRFKEKGGFTEDDTPCPINKYGLSKLMGEEEILKLKDKGLKYYIIRTSKLFGPKGSSNESKDSFFDLMLNISKDKEEINVVSEELSCFTYTKDLAKQTLDIINNEEDFGIYHIRNSDPAIWYDAARELFRIKNINVKINPVRSDLFPRPAKRPKYSVLANTKLQALRSWKEALEDYLKNHN